MKTKILSAALLASSVLAMGAFASSATAAAAPGNYNAGGIQPICLLANGTWYGEAFSGWGGTWGPGPTTEDATILHGNYASGAGNDSMNIKGRSVDWTEWQDDESYQAFLDTTFTKIRGACTPPVASAGHHQHPMD